MTCPEGCSFLVKESVFLFCHLPRVRPRVCARILSDNHHLVMDSIPQELIDKIIDNIPQSSLPSCALVARRWRRKSQQRVLDTILFSSEDEVNRWCADIAQDSDGISSYVHHVGVEVDSWTEPALLTRMLRSLSSLTALSMYKTEIPDELPGHISRGEFGNGITALYLGFSRYTLATVTSMIFSLPNLKELCVEYCEVTLEGPLPTHSVTPQRRSLDSLELHGRWTRIGEALAKSRLTSSRLSLDAHSKTVEQLLSLSSKMVVELELCGAWFLQVPRLSRVDSDQFSRCWFRSYPPSHPFTIVTCTYHSGHRH